MVTRMARQNRKADIVRINVDMHVDFKRKLDELVKKSSSHSMAEVVRRSIGILNVIVDTERSGGKVVLTSADGEETRLMLY